MDATLPSSRGSTVPIGKLQISRGLKRTAPTFLAGFSTAIRILRPLLRGRGLPPKQLWKEPKEGGLDTGLGWQIQVRVLPRHNALNASGSFRGVWVQWCLRAAKVSTHRPAYDTYNDSYALAGIVIRYRQKRLQLLKQSVTVRRYTAFSRHAPYLVSLPTVLANGLRKRKRCRSRTV